MNLRRKMRGVTLIELMIVVFILSLLIVIGYPNYQEFSARAKRNEARSALLRIATAQETFYLSNNTYTVDMTQLGFAAANNWVTPSNAYSVTVTAANAGNFSATASYLLAGAEAGKCLTFTVDGRGTQTSLPDTNCWSRTR